MFPHTHTPRLEPFRFVVSVKSVCCGVAWLDFTAATRAQSSNLAFFHRCSGSSSEGLLRIQWLARFIIGALLLPTCQLPDGKVKN